MNCLNKPFSKEFQTALQEAEATDDVSVMALTENGRAFCAGDDNGKFTRLQNPKVLFLNYLLKFCTFQGHNSST